MNQNRNWYADQSLDERKSWYTAVAADYNRVRPRYPQALIDRILELTQLPSDAAILEIGCGPGTATTSFAQLGFNLVSLEPSAEAFAFAQKNCTPYPNVKVIQTTFEEWELKPKHFDAVLAATSFHWVTPEVGYPKAAAALQESGFLILLWNMSLQPSNKVYQTLDSIYQTYAPALAGYETREMQNHSLKQFEQMVCNSGQFRDLVSEQFPCEVIYSIEDYLALLGTYSPYIALDSHQRESLFQTLRTRLKTVCGEFISLSYLSAFQLAVKA